MSRNISPCRINKKESMNCWFKIHKINNVILIMRQFILIMCRFIKMDKMDKVYVTKLFSVEMLQSLCFYNISVDIFFK
jgi:hypothetical protein